MENWCFWTVVLEKTLESPSDRKEIKPVTPKGNQPCIVIGRTDAEAEAPVVWPPDARSWLIGKDPDDGQDWGLEENEVLSMRHKDNITNTRDMNLSKLWVTVEDRRAWCATVHEVAKSQTGLSDWTTIRTEITVFFIKFEMLKKYPTKYIRISVFLCLPPSFPRWYEVIRLSSRSPQITDYSDVFFESSVCSGFLSLRLSHFFLLTWPLSLLSVLPTLMNK